VGADEKLDDARQGTMFSQRSMVGRAEGKISHQPYNSLDQRPAAWRVQKFHKNWQAIVKAHSILSHLGLWVTRCQVAKGTYLIRQKVATMTIIKEVGWELGTTNRAIAQCPTDV
jgi:hypothetical protein